MKRVRALALAAAVLGVLLTSAGCLTTRAEADLIRSDVGQVQAEVAELKRAREREKAEQAARLEQMSARVVALEATLHSLRQHDADAGVQMEKVIQELQILRGDIEEARFAIGQTQEALGETKKTVTDILARPPIEVAAAEAAPRLNQPEVLKIAGQPVPAEKQALYDFGVKLHKDGDPKGAIEALQIWADRHKDDKELIDNAWFWIAESYYQIGDKMSDKAERGSAFKKAILAYNKVIDVRYDTGQPSNKEDGALFKIGLAFEELGYSDEPKAFYEEILKQHPASPLAGEAKKRLATLGEKAAKKADKDAKGSKRGKGKKRR